MVLSMLREKTRPYHDDIEKNRLLRKLSGELKQQDYIAILKKFYGFYKPLEERLGVQAPALFSDLEAFYFPKLPLLENDLKEFSVSLVDLPICTFAPAPSSYCHWLGVLYTMEGSCHGRAMLWPRLHKKLGLEKGGSFFSQAGPDLKKHWGLFCERMMQGIKEEGQKRSALEGAIAAFVALNEWFNLE